MIKVEVIEVKPDMIAPNPQVKFVEGEMVWFRGDICSIVAVGGDLIVVMPVDPDCSEEIVAQRHQLEVVAQLHFEKGMVVASKKAFYGTVTGFEEESNRVIVKKFNCTDRVRYAYKPKDLRHIFNPGAF